MYDSMATAVGCNAYVFGGRKTIGEYQNLLWVLELAGCPCAHGYQGSTCSQYLCIPSCGHGGGCSGPDTCSCPSGWQGDLHCQNWSCDGVVCQNEGVCDGPNHCDCVAGWVGSTCSSFPPSLGTTVAIAVSVTVVVIIIVAALIVVLVVCLRKWSSPRLAGDEMDSVLINEQRESVAKLDIDETLFEIKYDELTVKKSIGSGGSSAVVFLCEWNGLPVAFKCFKLQNFLAQEKFAEFEKEVKILASVSHPHILVFYGACLSPPRIGIVMVGRSFSNSSCVSFSGVLLEWYGNGGPLADTWVYNLNVSAWEILTPSTSPSARYAVSGVALPPSAVISVVMFGGLDYTSDSPWTFSSVTREWTPSVVNSGSPPTQRCFVSMWPMKEPSVGFYTACGGFSLKLCNLVYRFEFESADSVGGSWALTVPSGTAPSPRSGTAHWVNYEGSREELWLFGGNVGTDQDSSLLAYVSNMSTASPYWTTVFDNGDDSMPVYAGDDPYPSARRFPAFDGSTLTLCDGSWLFLMFGGEGTGPLGGRGGLGDVWVLDMANVTVGKSQGWTFVSLDDRDDDAAGSSALPDFDDPFVWPGQRSDSGMAMVVMDDIAVEEDYYVAELFVFAGDSDYPDMWSFRFGCSMMCYGLDWDDPEACGGSSNGICVDMDSCHCVDPDRYDGPQCMDAVCHGLWGSEACNFGNGTCVDPDTCECSEVVDVENDEGEMVPATFLGENCTQLYEFPYAITGWVDRNNDVSQRVKNTESNLTVPFPGYRVGALFETIGDGEEILLFGGLGDVHVNDTWLYYPLLSRWEPLYPSASPAAVSYAASQSVGDSFSHVVHWGGTPRTGQDPPWVFSSVSREWTQVIVNEGASPPPDKDRMLVPNWPLKVSEVGSTGMDLTCGRDSSTLRLPCDVVFRFRFDDSALPIAGSWENYTLGGDVPSKRFGSSTWVNFAGSSYQLWLYGGNLNPSCSSTLAYADVLNSSWVLVSDEGNGLSAPAYPWGAVPHPGARYYIHGPTFPVCDSLVIRFGGFGPGPDPGGIFTRYLVDLWVLDMDQVTIGSPGGWTFVHLHESDDVRKPSTVPNYDPPRLAPGARYFPGVAFSAVTSEMLVFGGSSKYPDLWSLDLPCSVSCFGHLHTDPLVCNSRNGTCVAYDTCKCSDEYTGADCGTPICFGKNGSSACSTGDCVAPNVCDCEEGVYDGTQCEIPVCYGLTGNESCNGDNGTCVAPGTCQCTEELIYIENKGELVPAAYVGDECSLLYEYPYAIAGWVDRTSDPLQRIRKAEGNLTVPFPGYRHGFVFDAIQGTPDLLLFGGRQDGSYLSDTWLYHAQLSAWELVSPSVSPSPVSYVGFSSLNDKHNVFWGSYPSLTDEPPWVFSWDLRDWTESTSIGGTSPPSPRFHMSFWPVKESEVGFVGFDLTCGRWSSIFDCDQIFRFRYLDSANLTKGEWETYTPIGFAPSKRYGASTWGNFAGDIYQLWMYGGYDGSGGVTSSLLTYVDMMVDSYLWVVVSDAGDDATSDHWGSSPHPGARYHSSGPHSPFCDSLVVAYGGFGIGPENLGRITLPDLWILDLALAVPGTSEGWTFVRLTEKDDDRPTSMEPDFDPDPPGRLTPGPRYQVGVAFSAATSELFVFGGNTYYADLWSLSIPCGLSCFGHLVSDPLVCNQRNGTCVAYDTCNCTDPDLYTGADCSTPVCFGKNASDPSVCNSGRGDCVSSGVCVCRHNWENRASVCDDYRCEDGGGFQLESPGGTCSGHGDCTHLDSRCVCDSTWTTNHHSSDGVCGSFVCVDGIAHGDPMSCSGRGTCTEDDRACVCTEGTGWEGSDCGTCNDHWSHASNCTVCSDGWVGGDCLDQSTESTFPTSSVVFSSLFGVSTVLVVVLLLALLSLLLVVCCCPKEKINVASSSSSSSSSSSPLQEEELHSKPKQLVADTELKEGVVFVADDDIQVKKTRVRTPTEEGGRMATLFQLSLREGSVRDSITDEDIDRIIDEHADDAVDIVVELEQG